MEEKTIKCERCNEKMLSNAEIYGQLRYEIGDDSRSDLLVTYVDGKTTKTGVFGKTKDVDNLVEYELKARVCKKCGKVELYTDFLEI